MSINSPINTPPPVSETRDQSQVFMIVTDTQLEGLYRTRLQGQNYATIWCEGLQWQDALRRASYDIIVIDFALCALHPVDTLQEIKRLSPDSEIIVLSHTEDARTAIAAFRAGIADYFLKPIDPETLAWSIEKILRSKDFQSSNESLNADLRVFRMGHHINIAESDAKMRNLAVRGLSRMLGASGGIWIFPETESAESHFEALQVSEDTGNKLFEAFLARHPGPVQKQFETQLTSHPEKWVKTNCLWIPLRNDWMGGIWLVDCKSPYDNELQSRVEFLIRNLEISLDNARRFVAAKQLNYTDDLTGTYNSRYLDLALNDAITESETNANGFAVMFLDIDHFKSVNDKHGHLVGSHVLVLMARMLKHCLRKGDQVFRYGGDEFVCILRDASIAQAREVGERVRTTVERHVFKVQNVHLKLTVSIGVSRFPDHSNNKKEIIELADQAMYAGKKQGRNAVYLVTAEGAELVSSVPS